MEGKGPHGGCAETAGGGGGGASLPADSALKELWGGMGEREGV